MLVSQFWSSDHSYAKSQHKIVRQRADGVFMRYSGSFCADLKLF